MFHFVWQVGSSEPNLVSVQLSFFLFLYSYCAALYICFQIKPEIIFGIKQGINNMQINDLKTRDGLSLGLHCFHLWDLLSDWCGAGPLQDLAAPASKTAIHWRLLCGARKARREEYGSPARRPVSDPSQLTG